jgi:hypothetical protein
MVLSIVFVIMSAQGAEANGSDPPIHIHLTWGQNDTAHTIVVTWQTTNDNAGDNVLYDNQPRGGNENLYEYSATGSYHTYSGASGYIHDVELTGLSPDTTYYFICGGENGGWSDERSFRTAPDQSAAFRFVAGGDSRSGGTWPGPRDDISQEMAKFNPSFVLFSADFIFSWNDQDEWDNWFAAVQEYWVDNDNLTIPIIPCIGNHEVKYPQPSDYDPETEATNYYGQFYLPENERWYSLDWGPDLHITVLDGEIRSRSDAWNEQLSWLEKDLAAHENCRWKVAIFHRPAYSGGSHGSDWLTRADFVPRFDNYHVDLVLSGHDHGYERTYPIYQDNVQSSPEDGTVYIVSGGWGAPLYGGSAQWWTAHGPDSKYHFVVVDIFDNGTLHLRAVDRNGSVFDTFTIVKPRIDVSISPGYQGAPPKSTLDYTVTVTNTWTDNDNYVLTVSDTEGWEDNISLDDNLLTNVQPGENRVVTLSVTIPENAVYCTEDSITVTATSENDNTISDNDNCIAHAAEPRAELGLVSLYKVELDLDVYLDNGSKLVVKFYKYDNTTLQAENVVWENVTPAHVVLLENVSHPEGSPVPPSHFPNGTVQIAKLVLTTNDTENEISTLASFTAHQCHLRNRYIEILLAWGGCPSCRPAFRAEIIDILLQWASAPSKDVC